MKEKERKKERKKVGERKRERKFRVNKGGREHQMH